VTITDLITLLEEARDQVGDDAEIQLATQASYPLRYDLRGVYIEPDNADKAADELVVWLVEGQQDRHNPYDVPEYAFADARTALCSDDPPRATPRPVVGRRRICESPFLCRHGLRKSPHGGRRLEEPALQRGQF
jgi:hypothetical protein